jgi:hypothetical protein
MTTICAGLLFDLSRWWLLINLNHPLIEHVEFLSYALGVLFGPWLFPYLVYRVKKENRYRIIKEK